MYIYRVERHSLLDVLYMIYLYSVLEFPELQMFLTVRMWIERRDAEVLHVYTCVCYCAMCFGISQHNVIVICKGGNKQTKQKRKGCSECLYM